MGGGNGKQRKMQEEAIAAVKKREGELAKMQRGGGNGKEREA